MVRLPLVLVAFSRRRSSGWRQGGATGSSLCFPVRRLVAVVAAHLSLALVVFLRLGSGWGLRFDVTTASCPVTAAWPLCVGVWSLRLSVSGRPLSDFLRLTVAPTRDRPYIPWSGVLGGVVSARAGRPVVVFVRLLLVLRIAQWEEMKNFVSTEPSAFQKL